MSGFAMTVPALAFFAERMAASDAAVGARLELHIGLLTSSYALAQLATARLWGTLSDRMGRRTVVAVGMGGFALAAVFFGLSTHLWMLYPARILGGALSSAILPAATAYVADWTTDEQRVRGMGMLSGAVSLGGIAGPAIGALLARKDLHFRWRFGVFHADSFSMPFFAAAALGAVALGLELASVHEPARPVPMVGNDRHRASDRNATHAGVLVAYFGAQLVLALFEATAALLAQHRLKYGPTQTGVIFVVCGMVMASIQLLWVGRAVNEGHERTQAALGFVLMAIGLAILAGAGSLVPVLAGVTSMAAGVAVSAPNLAALASHQAARGRGQALGALAAAQGLGQVVGPILGLSLFGWSMAAPYLLAGAVALALAGWLGAIPRRA
jgi:DHA1 family multidrug resistance protein-like MFS transporter